ncbi:9320_t:CDS:2 [Cetraspora pellucida]|uniref:9320_t:CDS:1 n=1 Tax=Cetraspora pellucida TaxID=1433469 RepID=A0ACA9JWM6_9GLOM|nr:9320_t:CDS:2 [Cetraspora pellucida]
MKYAATWSNEDQSICGWQISNDFGFKFECSARIQDLYEDFYSKNSGKKLDVRPQLESISDNKLVVINLAHRIEQGPEMSLRREIRAYHSTDNGKLFILDTCGLLTQWDLYTLQFEKQYLLKWDKIWITHGLEQKFYIFNNNFTLLAICLQAFGYLFINVYLTENAIPLSQCKYKKRNKKLSHLEFISFDEGERLLLFFEDIIEIRDPYCLDHKIEVSNLCEEFLAEINGNEYIQNADLYVIKNESIYTILGGHIIIKKFTKVQWINFLRKKLHDYNEIRSLPSKLQIKDFLQKILNENSNKRDDEFIISKDVEKSYKGFLVEWKLMKNERKGNTLQVFGKFDANLEVWNKLDVREIKPDHLLGYKFVYKCKLLDNEDLAMITTIGLLIWTIWQKKKIRLRYYKGFPFTSYYLKNKDFENRYILGAYINKEYEYKKLEFFAKKPYIKKLIEEIRDYKKNILPPSDFDAVVQYHEELCINKRPLFDELLDDYIEDKILLALYGQQLLRCLLKNNNYIIAEKLYRQCIEINQEQPNFLDQEQPNFLINIKLLEIITSSFIDLSQKFPDLLKEFLSHIAFIVLNGSKDLVDEKILSISHLQNYRTYSHPSNQDFLIHLDELQDMIKIIKNNKWKVTDEKPYLSGTILNITGVGDIGEKKIDESNEQIKQINQKIDENNEKVNEKIDKLMELIAKSQEYNA